jgi:hypothetical protein
MRWVGALVGFTQRFFMDLEQIINKHNQLQDRLDKAEELFEKTENPPSSWTTVYKNLLVEQSNNFEEFYIYYYKSDVDKLVDSNKQLTLLDFQNCRKTGFGK